MRMVIGDKVNCWNSIFAINADFLFYDQSEILLSQNGGQVTTDHKIDLISRQSILLQQVHFTIRKGQRVSRLRVV
jgi:hypothetical protein